MGKMRVYLAGHNGMVGSAIKRQLEEKIKKGENLDIITGSREKLDLTKQVQVQNFMFEKKPDLVIIAAAKVGGIHANNVYPAEFIYENMMIEFNVIHQAWLSGVKKLLFLGSSCVYPKLAQQPMSENALLMGPLEPTNEPYAISKIAGIKMCESYNRQYGVDYRSVMPTNLYGPFDNFHNKDSHVVPSLINRFHEAKQQKMNEVKIWGTGRPYREFLHVDDMADASLFLLNLPSGIFHEKIESMVSHVNVGSGKEVSIRELAVLIREITGFEGNINFDSNKLDGAPRKLMDSSLLKSFGWKASIDLKDGLLSTYNWYLKNVLKSKEVNQ